VRILQARTTSCSSGSVDLAASAVLTRTGHTEVSTTSRMTVRDPYLAMAIIGGSSSGNGIARMKSMTVDR
jgi:hypothetical protein